MPQHPTESSEMLTRIAGQVPVISTRRGFRGWSIDGRPWEPFAIMGGDGEEESETPPPPPPSDPPKEEQKQPENFSREYVEGLRKEAAENRKKAAAAEAKLKEQDDAKLSETERLQKERDEFKAKSEQAEARARATLVEADIRVLASTMKFADLDDPLGAIKLESVEFDANGKPTNVKKLLEDLAKAKPHWIKAEGGGSAGVPGTPRSNGHTPTHEERVNEIEKRMEGSGRYARL
jgi:hypothetical protein